jgi:hypothetical protein
MNADFSSGPKAVAEQIPHTRTISTMDRSSILARFGKACREGWRDDPGRAYREERLLAPDMRLRNADWDSVYSSPQTE